MTTPATVLVPATALRSLDALNRVLASVESVRNGGAVDALLATFAAAGLLLPALVYLRGTCSVYLAFEERDDAAAP